MNELANVLFIIFFWVVAILLDVLLLVVFWPAGIIAIIIEIVLFIKLQKSRKTSPKE